MDISVIIPTKNRRNDLFEAIKSISAQSVSPKELIIVDQSDTRLSENDISLIDKIVQQKIQIIYHYDISISGLVAAKDFGIKLAKCSLISFLEDDVIIENNYFEEVIKGFIIKPEMKGCSGIVVNPSEQKIFYALMHRISHLGIFKDIRPLVFNKYQSNQNSALIQSQTISGGISIWRYEVFNYVKFDMKNGFHFLEDIEFSIRVFNFYKGELYINTAVRLVHNHSSSGREFDYNKHRRKIKEFFLFYKKNANGRPFSQLNIFWLVVCLILQASVKGIYIRDFNALKGLIAGIKEGIVTKLKS